MCVECKETLHVGHTSVTMESFFGGFIGVLPIKANSSDSESVVGGSGVFIVYRVIKGGCLLEEVSLSVAIVSLGRGFLT